MDKRNIILTGFMGTGKTVVGQMLARNLNRDFKDTDEEVERAAGKTVPQIFAEEGEEIFRRHETDVIRKLQQYPRGSLVIATGGGAVLKEENRCLLRELGMVVLLTAPEDEIYRRVGQTDRPLLKAGDARKRITELLQGREQLYREAAHVTIDTGGKTPREIARAITGMFNK